MVIDRFGGVLGEYALDASLHALHVRGTWRGRRLGDRSMGPFMSGPLPLFWIWRIDLHHGRRTVLWEGSRTDATAR